MKNQKTKFRRTTLGGALMDYTLAISLVAITFGIIIPGLNSKIKDLNPETIKQVTEQAARDSYSCGSGEYYFGNCP